METITPKSINVILSAAQKRRMSESIINKSNINKACGYAGIATRYLHKALNGGNIKSDKRDLLLAFCDLVEGKTAA